MTPDGNPLLGPMPGVPGFWMAAGLSLNGFGGAGGIGKTIAEWMTRRRDRARHARHAGLAVRRGLPQPPAQVEAAGREVYRYYYRLRYPLDADEWGRPNRLSPLHGRLQDLGAVFGVEERLGAGRPPPPGAAVAPGRRRPARRTAGRARPSSSAVAEEHRAFRERAGMIDMTSFGKIEVEGPGALPLLERVCDNRIDRPPGSVVYTQLLNARGGIVADVTVTRLGEQRFRVVTGAGVVDSDIGWLRLHVRDEDGPVAMREVTRAAGGDRHLGAAGARRGGGVQRRRRVRRGLPVPHGARDRDRPGRCWRSGSPTSASSDSSCTPSRRTRCRCGTGWRPRGASTASRSAATGRSSRCGMEKGYRYMGTDLTAGDTPYEAGLGFCVALDKGEFIGREALGRPGPSRRAGCARCWSAARTTCRVRRRGGAAWTATTAGRVRSCAYGFTVEGGRSRTRTCRPTSPTTPGSRSRCWAGRSRPSWPPTCWSTPSTPASAHDTAVTGA